MMIRKTGSYGIIDRPEYEYSGLTCLLIQPDRHVFYMQILLNQVDLHPDSGYDILPLPREELNDYW